MNKGKKKEKRICGRKIVDNKSNFFALNKEEFE